MSFVIGFGSTEKSLENKIEKQITDWIYDSYCKSDHSHFSDNFAKEVKNYIDAMASESRKEAESYKSVVDFPSRYSSFYQTVLHDPSCMAIILKFHHINRRHAMSPDGWAMLQNQKVFVIEEWEAGRKRRNAA
jgi:hypothetical protein